MAIKSAGRAEERRLEIESEVGQSWCIKTATTHSSAEAKSPFQGIRKDILILSLLAIVLTVIARVNRFDAPLERDEGEYAYAGQLILEGVPPYTAAYNMKLPGTYLAYAAIMGVFGQTATAIRAGVLLVNLLTCWLIFLIGKRILDVHAGLAAAAAFAVMSCQTSVLGLWGHATHFVTAAAMAGVWALVMARESGKASYWFLSGLGFGSAFVMKQHGVFFIGFGFFSVLWMAWRKRSTQPPRQALASLALNGLGAAIPFLLVLIWVTATGSASKFWFWTFDYAHQYAGQLGFETGLNSLREVSAKILKSTVLLWTLAFFGILSTGWLNRGRFPKMLLAGLAVFSFLTTCPGNYFREHYFIPVLPVGALFAGVGALMLLEWKSPVRHLAVTLLGLALLSPMLIDAGPFYTWTNLKLTREHFTANPFVEAPMVADYIREHTEPTDQVAVIGSEPQVYFYAKRRSATSYIYMYCLMEAHPFARAMQQELAAQIEKARPKFVVVSELSASWLKRGNSDFWIFEWMPGYVGQHYELIGMAEYDDQMNMTMKWDETGRTLNRDKHHTFLVMRRKDTTETAQPGIK